MNINQKKDNIFSDIIFFILPVLVIFAYVSPYIILKEDSFVLIHDHLDSNLLHFKILAGSDMIFSSRSTIVDQFMSVSRSSLGNELDFTLLLFFLFEPFNAFVIDQILIRLIAFLGMYLLLNRYVFKSKEKPYLTAIAVLYSILPFYPLVGLSVAGLPLIVYVFLNLRFGIDKRSDWIVLILFPFYSSFLFSIFFLIILISFVWLLDVYNKKVKKKFILALFILITLYLLANYRYVDIFLLGVNGDFVSHRTEFFSTPYGLKRSIGKSIYHFLFGQYHASSLHTILIPFISIVFFINLFSKKKDHLILILSFLTGAISLWYGFIGSEFLNPLISLLFSKIPIQLSRFYILGPLIWFTLFALTVRYIITNYNFKILRSIVWIMIGLSFINMIYKSDFINEYRKNNITYAQFYSKNLFQNIEKFINKDQSSYKVVSIGIHPSIASYNGFYTLDGYSTVYSLNYKYQFREIIAQELEKNQILKKYYDRWGSRVYIFADQIGINYLRKKNAVYPININLNTSELYDMGGRYIFSTYKIKNYVENNLQLLKIFSNEKSVWKIYLYKVKS